MHLRVPSWNCVLCYSSIEEDEEVMLATAKHVYVLKRAKKKCPRQFCPFCKQSDQALPCHQLCWAIAKLFPENIAFPQLFQLGQACVPCLPVDDPPSNEHVLHMTRESLCHSTLETVPVSRSGHDGSCNCIACLLHRLSRLPTELLTNFIAPLATQDCLWRLFPIFGETAKLLHELERPHSGQRRRYRVSVRGAVFETRINFGRASYVTGLYDEQVEGSHQVKSATTPCRFVVIWLDKLGVTNVEFLPDCHPSAPAKRRLGYWVHALQVNDDYIHVSSKGVFLDRIMVSEAHAGRTLWESHTSPLLFRPDALKQIRRAEAAEDMLVRCVSLDNSCGFSVAFVAGDLLCILSHTKMCQDQRAYAEQGPFAVWTYVPTSAEDRIVGIWAAYPRNHRLGLSAIIVKTQRKLIWLGIVPSQLDSCIVKVACDSVRSIYYSDPRTSHNLVFGTYPPMSGDDANIEPPPAFPVYRTPVPGSWRRDLYHSEASLEAVEEVRLCLDEKDCIGLFLQYEKHSTTVGQFREDKDTSQFVSKPRYIAISPVLGEEKFRIFFSNERPQGLDESTFQEMVGHIVWWYGRENKISIC